MPGLMCTLWFCDSALGEPWRFNRLADGEQVEFTMCPRCYHVALEAIEAGFHLRRTPGGRVWIDTTGFILGLSR